MNTVTIEGVGVVRIPERNTREEIVNIVNTLGPMFPELYKELIVINEYDICWCEHEDCLEETEPFNSESELGNHTFMHHNDLNEDLEETIDSVMELSAHQAVKKLSVEMTKEEILNATRELEVHRSFEFHRAAVLEMTKEEILNAARELEVHRRGEILNE